MEQLIFIATAFADAAAGLVAIVGMIAVGALILIYTGNFGWLVIETAITAYRRVKDFLSTNKI